MFIVYKVMLHMENEWIELSTISLLNSLLNDRGLVFTKPISYYQFFDILDLFVTKIM